MNRKRFLVRFFGALQLVESTARSAKESAATMMVPATVIKVYINVLVSELLTAETLLDQLMALQSNDSKQPEQHSPSPGNDQTDELSSEEFDRVLSASNK